MEAGEILLRRGLIDRRQLELSRTGRQEGGSLVDSAVDLGFVSEEEALKALGEEVGLDYVELAEEEIDLSLLKSFPNKLIHRQSLFPIRRENGELVVDMSEEVDRDFRLVV